MISIQEVEEMLNDIAEEFPKELFEKLNGGIILLPKAKQHNKSIDNDLWILGEYHYDRNMGRYIAIYYGSVKRIFGNLSKEQLKNRLRHTLKHEFTHHLESLAGEKGLEIEDKRNLEKYLKRKNDSL